jgi:hypothetical protein
VQICIENALQKELFLPAMACSACTRTEVRGGPGAENRDEAPAACWADGPRGRFGHPIASADGAAGHERPSGHSRSDRHSKIACWAVLFDLLRQSELMQIEVARGRIVFGVNHEMSDFRTGCRKNLDLVLARPGPPSTGSEPTFRDLVDGYGISLTEEEFGELGKLPRLARGTVGSVLLALEAKACMTEHGKARPRLYDELNSSHVTIHGSAAGAIAVAFVMVNVAESFVSPDRNKCDTTKEGWIVTHHQQPKAAEIVIEKVHEMPRRTRFAEEGFDAIGIAVISCRNDGSPIELVRRPPAPAPTDDYEYGQMVRRVRQLYEVHFPGSR